MLWPVTSAGAPGGSPAAFQLQRSSAGREQRLYVAAARADDQRVQLQLPLLPYAARPRDAADAPYAGGAGASVSCGAPPRLVPGAFHHDGDPRAPDKRDGRSDPGARAAAVETWVPWLHPRQGRPRG